MRNKIQEQSKIVQPLNLKVLVEEKIKELEKDKKLILDDTMNKEFLIALKELNKTDNLMLKNGINTNTKLFIKEAKIQELKEVLKWIDETQSQENKNLKSEQSETGSLDTYIPIKRFDEFVEKLKGNKFVKISFGESDDYKKGFLDGVKYMKEKIDKLSSEVGKC